MLLFLPSSQPWFTVRLLALRASRTAGTCRGGKGDLGLLKLAPVPKERDMQQWPAVHVQTPTHNLGPGKASGSTTLPRPHHLIQYEMGMRRHTLLPAPETEFSYKATGCIFLPSVSGRNLQRRPIFQLQQSLGVGAAVDNAAAMWHCTCCIGHPSRPT